MKLINLDDYENSARNCIDKRYFDYYAGGSDDETTCRENREAYRRVRLLPAVLKGVGTCDTSVELLGLGLTMPVLIAPTAMHGLAHADGEMAVARAAAQEGIVMMLSTTSTYSMDEVITCAPGRLWFQLYIHKRSHITRWLVQNAERAGYTALVVTVDTPVLGNRERDVRNAFVGQAFQEKIHLLTSLGGGGKTTALGDYASMEVKAAASWEDIDWIRSITRLPVLVKGIYRPEDALLAVAHQTAGIIVSNHGGRQLDGVPATIELLPAVAKAVDKRVPVLLDGGIRRGTDIVKALALGATAVAIGRPALWGLAVGGETGVRDVLRILREELTRSMALCGVGKIGDIGEHLSIQASPHRFL
jgi:4-hydroxymandelate oxidase